MTKKNLFRPLILISILFLIASNKTFALDDAAPCFVDANAVNYRGPFSTIFDGNKSIDKDCQYPGDNSPLVTEVIDNGRIFSRIKKEC